MEGLGMPVSIRGKRLILNTEWCKGCGICAAFCPKSVLILENGKAAIRDEEKCIGCGLCEMRCPDYAVYLEEAPDEQ
jgi:2-oxoglutarate ferredoxin oxidoreductase subunit delta